MQKWPGIILRMNKLALIGKDISHSRSPEMYRKLISPSIDYTLLDYKSPDEIPSAKTLLSIYDGINITSPYKKHFLSEVKLTSTAQEIGAINCLKKNGDEIVGENTDYLAIVDILQRFKKDYGELDVVILGDGVMSIVVQVALQKLNIQYEIFSRKITQHFDQLNLSNHIKKSSVQPLIINACARDFIFHGKLPINAIFWDFNYNFEQQKKIVSPLVAVYIDGLEMLERQAFYAVAFWSNSTSA